MSPIAFFRPLMLTQPFLKELFEHTTLQSELGDKRYSLCCRKCIRLKFSPKYVLTRLSNLPYLYFHTTLAPSYTVRR